MKNQPINVSVSQNDEIDLIELGKTLWKKRRFISKGCILGAFAGLIIVFSIPKEYETAVQLTPENNATNKSGQLSGLAAMAGINFAASGVNADALYPDLYPDIVRSTPFLLELIDLPVETCDGKNKISFYDYILEHQRSAWWQFITSAPVKAIGWMASLFSSAPDRESDTINPFSLTKKQEDFIRKLRAKITVRVDAKTGVVRASVWMQDPLVSATVMEVVLERLQAYITDYRTRKARHDLAFSEKLFSEARENYYKAQKTYARYVDVNRNVTAASFRTEEERLRNEMNLTFGVYNQMAQQLEMNKIKVQEQTPVYTLIEPARVPLKAAKPSKILILAGLVFLAGSVSIGWVLIKNSFLNLQKTKLE